MNKQININELFELFQRHFTSCKSKDILCNTPASFESWFRAELMYVLDKCDYDVSHNYSYPKSRKKADISENRKKENRKKADISVNNNIIFELKCFVESADSHKRKNFPIQTKRLISLLNIKTEIIQVITFTTFFGYKKEKMNEIIDKCYIPKNWKTIGPKKLSKDHELYLLITSKTRDASIKNINLYRS